MKKKLLEPSIFLGVFMIVGLIYSFGLFSLTQDEMVDRFFLKHDPHEKIIIIGVDDNSLNAIGRWPWSRKVFADIIPDLQSARVIGFDINFAEPAADVIEGSQSGDDSLAKALEASKVPVVMPVELRKDGLVSVKPLDIFSSHARLGFANAIMDSDGVVRYADAKLGNYTSIAAVLSDVGEATTTPLESPYRIDYVGGANTFPTISLVDVYHHKIPSRIFDGATVLIGSTANDLHDFLGTPFGMMPGVEVIANNIHTLESGNFISKMPLGIGLLIIFILDLLCAVVISKIKRFNIISLVLVSEFVLIILSSFVLFHFHIIFPLFYALLGFALTNAFMLSYHYIKEASEKRFIRSTFQYYLSGDVIEELVQNPEKLRLGGSRRNVTILFSDVRDFTTISESMTPEDLTSFMSSYFTIVSDIVMDGKGVIDKYIGDAIMAFWGAPLDNPTHPEDTCRVALDMISKLESHNKVLKEKNLPVIHIGIGINTGEVIVGNMGSLKRFNYTIVGDNVNFTSRLEGLTKQYGVTCIISESTKDAIKSAADLYTRELDEVLVKGKKTPKKIFELMKMPTDENILSRFRSFDEGRKLYIEGRFEDAIKKFEEANKEGDDKASKIFIERCRNLVVNPPENWTGIYEFKTK